MTVNIIIFTFIYRTVHSSTADEDLMLIETIELNFKENFDWL